MPQLTPVAEAVSNEIVNAFNRFSKRVDEASKPLAAESIFNSDELSIRRQNRVVLALEKNARELEALTEDTAKHVEKMKGEIEKKLRPLQHSESGDRRVEGRMMEEKAQRIVRALPPKGIENEYARAVELKQTDYASEIVRWVELYAEGSTDITEREFVRRFKAQHESWVGLGDLRYSIETLQARLEQLRQGNPFAKAKPNITQQINLRRNDREFANILEQIA